MSLDIDLVAPGVVGYTVYSDNITSNLATMAQSAGLYECVWHPESVGITVAAQMIAPLSQGIARLKAMPAYFANFAAPDGWGTYPQMLGFLEAYHTACVRYPEAKIDVSR